MEGDVFFTGDRRTDIQTDGHRQSMTELAQWADSVKKTTSVDSNTLVCSKYTIVLFVHNLMSA